MVTHLGIKQTRFRTIFGVLGLAIGYALFAYLELTSSHLGERSDLLLLVGNILCPPALLSIFLFDLNAHSVEAFIAWSIIALLNAGFYAVIGKLIGRFLLRKPQPTAN